MHMTYESVIVTLTKALAFVLLSILLTKADDNDHEYAPIVESKKDFFDLSLQTLDGKPSNLRSYVESKQLVLINFSASWCKNSNYNAPVIKRLFSKYKDRGLGAVLIMEYANKEDVADFINRFAIDFPVM